MASLDLVATASRLVNECQLSPSRGMRLTEEYTQGRWSCLKLRETSYRLVLVHANAIRKMVPNKQKTLIFLYTYKRPKILRKKRILDTCTIPPSHPNHNVPSNHSPFTHATIRDFDLQPRFVWLFSSPHE
mmetsp:Transcript_4561/g.8396  ORF Transcript_4561/g.8396 Transcript_4561/m.8396 type:complete len:130 (+) Transcript_4561:256-645(+)